MNEFGWARLTQREPKEARAEEPGVYYEFSPRVVPLEEHL